MSQLAVENPSVAKPEDHARKVDVKEKISDYVLAELGKPPNFSTMTVKGPLWETSGIARYRINIYVEIAVTKEDGLWSDSNISDSFLVLYDTTKEQVIQACPDIRRKYNYFEYCRGTGPI